MNCSDNFHIEEFVPDTVYAEYLQASAQFVDRRIIRVCEKMRKYLKTEIIINTWQYTTEQLTYINTKYGTNYDLVNRLTQRGYIIPTTTTDLQQIEQMSGRAIIFDAIGLTNAEVLSVLQNDYGTYRLYGLTNARIVGTSLYIDIRQMKLDDSYPLILNIIPT